MVDVQVQNGICVIEPGAVSVYTVDGRDYVTYLPFQVSNAYFQASAPRIILLILFLLWTRN